MYLKLKQTGRGITKGQPGKRQEKRDVFMATREDVARLAGVSGATVARVFSNSSNVSVKTTAKVLDAARFLEYAPNFYGRALRGKSPKQLLVYSSGAVSIRSLCRSSMG